MHANKDIHLAESSKKPAAVPDASHDTRRQDEPTARIRVSKPFAHDSVKALVLKDPGAQPEISPRSVEQREPLAVPKHTLATVRTDDAEDSMTEPHDIKLSPPAAPARQRRPVVSFASPLVTNPNSQDTFRVASKARLTPDIRSNTHDQIGAFEHEIHAVNIRTPKEPLLGRNVSLVSDEEMELPRPTRKPSSHRVRFDDMALQASALSPSPLKVTSRPVKQTSGRYRNPLRLKGLTRLVARLVPSPLEKRATNSPMDSSHRNIKSNEGDDIQDIVDVRKTAFTAAALFIHFGQVLNDIQTVKLAS
jgi:hypothetical protein